MFNEANRLKDHHIAFILNAQREQHLYAFGAFLIVMKVTYQLDWHWFWILSPFWAPMVYGWLKRIWEKISARIFPENPK
jgi:hypothetical protein